MTDATKFKDLTDRLEGAVVLSPLELNALRFSGKKTIVTEARLKLRTGSKKRGVNL